jgi:hypothetical protein
VTLWTQGLRHRAEQATIVEGDDVFEAGRRSVSLSREPFIDRIRQLKAVMWATVHSSWHKVKEFMDSTCNKHSLPARGKHVSLEIDPSEFQKYEMMESMLVDPCCRCCLSIPLFWCHFQGDLGARIQGRLGTKSAILGDFISRSTHFRLGTEFSVVGG